MSKHTKGPFEVTSSIMVCSPTSKILANCLPTGIESLDVSFEEAVANTQLFASSTELLAACRAVVKYHRENDSGEGELFGLDFVTTCIAAIAKVEEDN
ncbi:hypothetical protein LCGC14_2146910 [marine sediment metagenome]|uniref:Uncharacterized protein n=1 Tax=marine sediment metagenome TaxID=412755 RepID=A0A0F9DWY4_9ZZZZ